MHMRRVPREWDVSASSLRTPPPGQQCLSGSIPPRMVGPPLPVPRSHHASPPRRRSLDLGRLARARHTPAPRPACSGKDTETAELLAAMYTQTRATADIQREEYDLLSAPLAPAHRARLVDSLATWHFSPHLLPPADLFHIASLIFEAVLAIHGLAHLAIPPSDIDRLLFAIRAIYHAPNPYHNYVHAIDVLQATYTFLLDLGVVPDWAWMRTARHDGRVWHRSDTVGGAGKGTTRARALLRPQDVFAVLIAAIGHDAGHPGLSNAFMKNAKVPLSQVYQDTSVLENMHCMLIVQLLRKYGFGFLLHAPPGPPGPSPAIDHKGFRKILYSAILATDMSLHFAWVQRLRQFDQQPTDLLTPEDERILVCQALIKCADISNPTRPIDVSQHWSSVLLEEWAKQASLEQDLSLPISVVPSADAALQAKGQIGFIEVFTRPLFEAVSEAFPELGVYAESCVLNQELWEARLAGAGAGAGGGVVQPVVENASQDERFQTLFPLLLPTSLVPHSHPHPPISPFGPATPPTYSFRDPSAPGAAPSTTVIRAVYHTQLVDPEHPRPNLAFGSGSGSHTERRRMSAPHLGRAAPAV